MFVFYSIHVESDLILTVKGSFEETQKISLGPDSSQSSSNIIQFHCIKNHQSNLEITLPTKIYWSKVLLSWIVLLQWLYGWNKWRGRCFDKFCYPKLMFLSLSNFKMCVLYLKAIEVEKLSPEPIYSIWFVRLRKKDWFLKHFSRTVLSQFVSRTKVPKYNFNFCTTF